MTITPTSASVTLSGSVSQIAAAIAAADIEPVPPVLAMARAPLHFKTGANAERIEWLMLTTGNGVWNFQSIYSLNTGPLAAGSIIQFCSDPEFTNTLTYNIMIAGNTVLTDSPTSTTGVHMNKRSGFNITPNPGTHHGVLVRSGTHMVTEDMADSYVNVIAYASSSAAGPTHGLKVEQNYGDLSVIIWPPAADGVA